MVRNIKPTDSKEETLKEKNQVQQLQGETNREYPIICPQMKQQQQDGTYTTGVTGDQTQQPGRKSS
jgi:hypothetical protein